MPTKFSKISLATVFILIIALFPFQAKAFAPWLIYLGISAGIPLGLGILKGIASIGAFIIIAGGVSFLAAQLVDWGIRFQNTLLSPNNLPIIQTVWGLLRDFVNIFFILILLVIAFATIFNVKNYKASDLLPKLIIAVLLINFSLVITSWVIDLLWVPAAVFLRPLGQDVSGQIVETLRIQDFFSAENLAFLAKNLFEGISGVTEIVFREAIFRGILLVINAFILSWIALIIWVRIPVLIGLMIVSPIAWLGLTLPAIRKNTWNAWWQKLFCWASIPIPLFGLIYFVILFNQRLRVEMSQTALGSVLNTVLPFLGFTVGQTLVWIITAGVLLAGLMYIKGLSCSVYGWISKGFFGTWRGIRRGVGATVDYGYAATGYKGAVGRVQEEIKEGGLPIFGRRMFGAAQREARETRREDQLRGLMGLPPTFAKQRDRVEKAEKEAKNLETRIKASTETEARQIIADLKTSVAEKSAKKEAEMDPETLAAISILAKRGELEKDLFDNAAKQFEKLPLAMTKVFSDWKEGKFGGLTAKEFLEIARRDTIPAEARRTAYAFLATEDAKIVTRDMTDEDYQKGYEILRKNTKEGRDFKRNIGKLRPTIVAKYNLAHIDEEIIKPEDREKIRAEKPENQLAATILNQIEGSGAKEMGDFDKKEWDNEDFKKALNNMIKNKKEFGRQYVQELRRRFVREGKDKQLESLNSLGNVRTVGSERAAGGERRTPGGVILTPGAQFEIEREEEESQKKTT